MINKSQEVEEEEEVEEKEEESVEVSVFSEPVVCNGKSFLGVIEQKEKEIQKNMKILENSPTKLSIIERLKKNRLTQLQQL